MQKGVTLIELIIVIAILSILVTVGGQAFSSFTSSSNATPTSGGESYGTKCEAGNLMSVDKNGFSQLMYDPAGKTIPCQG
jgi:prepilin-type N-terminal cleavage/methylation domain-containing protein